MTWRPLISAKSLRKKWQVYRQWVRQGRPRDKWVILAKGTWTDEKVTGWWLDNRYCTKPDVVGVSATPSSVELIGGYTRAEMQHVTTMPTATTGHAALTCRVFGHRYYCGPEGSVYRCTRVHCQASLPTSTTEQLGAGI